MRPGKTFISHISLSINHRVRKRKVREGVTPLTEVDEEFALLVCPTLSVGAGFALFGGG